MKKIQILSGPIRTGKTTRLMKWAANKKNVDGIFQPVVDSKRFIYHISSRTLKPLETDLEINSIKIGKYFFSKETFQWAQNQIIHSLSTNIDWLIIDEIGPLELQGAGLEPTINKIINEAENLKANILCVVRDNLLAEFLSHYGLENRIENFSFEE